MPESRTRLRIEIAIVLALSLGASAIYSLVAIVARLTSETRLADQTATLNRQLSEREWLDFAYQFLGLAFGLAPVALVLFLLWKNSKSPFKQIGLNFERPAQDLVRGIWLAALIGIPGLGFYLAARFVGISAEVIPAALGQYWWTIPMLLLAAFKASLLEEVIVVGYLFQRLNELGFSKKGQVLFSATLRASYHLYQGFGGFIGNFAMGIVFGYLYHRFGRVMPLVVAHFILDAAVFVGYALLKDSLFFL
jgi:uncharacterized protein